MKIGMFLDSPFPPDSRVENEAHSLIQSGHEVHLFCVTFNEEDKKNEIYSGIYVHRYYFNRILRSFSALAFTSPLFRWYVTSALKQFVKEVKPEVLHAHDMIMANAVIKIFSKQYYIIADLHENRPVIMQEYGFMQKWYSKLLIRKSSWTKAQNKVITKADKVILVTNEAINQAIKETGCESSHFIPVPNTIHPDIFLKYKIDSTIKEHFSENFTIIYTGDTGLRRGTDTLIKAAAILEKSIPELKIVIVGSNSEDTVLYELCQSLNLENIVVFKGWQDVSLFPSYIKSADIAVSPLKRNLHHDTTFANKIFQYMACSVPIIASDCVAQKNVITSTNSGWIHEANNHEHLAEVILKAYRSPNERLKRGKNGLEAVLSEWNWNITSQPIISFYNNLEVDLQ